MYGRKFLGNCLPGKSRSVSPALATIGDTKYILACICLYSIRTNIYMHNMEQNSCTLAVSVQPVIIVVGSAFAASAELGVAVIMLILPPSLRNTYHPAYLMCCRSVDHAARQMPC